MHRTVAPAPLLRPFVRAIWYFEGQFAHRLERIVPGAEMQLLVNLDADELRSYHGADLDEVERLRGACVSGPFGRSFGIDTAEQRRIAGVTFYPGGATPFFRTPASALRDQHVELDELWGRDGVVLRERLLAAGGGPAILAALHDALMERARRPLRRDASVDAAMAALVAGASVRGAADALGASTRALGRRFAAQVGLSPKQFARVQRFQRVIDEVSCAPPASWAELAARHGYCDQAHLVRDFREFAGVPPTAYAPRAPGHGTHVAVQV